MNRAYSLEKPATTQTVDLIIKFGGSAITDKNSFETLRPAQLSAAVDIVRQCVVDNGLSCIVVHGAGSFGHHQAREFQVNTGLVTTQTKEEREKKILGYSLTRQSVTKLNQLVINNLIERGVPAIQCSPGSSWELDKRQPVKWPWDLVAGFLRQGLVPVFHGDCCLDAELGCCILSGDTVIKLIGLTMGLINEDGSNGEWSSKVSRAITNAINCYKELYLEKRKKAVQQTLDTFFVQAEKSQEKRQEESLCAFFDVKRVIFLTDVDGIYDKPPDQPDAKLMKTICVSRDGSVKHLISTSQSRNDVTGGILLKLTTATDIVTQTKGRCVVHVCGVDSPEAASVCLGSSQDKCCNFTTVCLESNELDGGVSANSQLDGEVSPNNQVGMICTA